jgi:hypothetical protein
MTNTQNYQILICFISIVVFLYIINNLNSKIILIYKNPIFKVIFLLLLYYYGSLNKYLTILLAIYYIYIGQLIQKIELLYNI